MSYQNHGSFMFDGIDMYDRFGIMILNTGMPQDSFLPAIRERKVQVPRRHGQYDFGAKYYDERTLTLDCVTGERMSNSSFRATAREMAYILSKKSEIRLWNEPDVYYVGRLYDEIQLVQLRDTAIEFTLNFICEPFAYGLTVYEDFDEDKRYVPNYKGTASTPAYIEIVNNGPYTVKNIRISQVNRKDSY